MTISGFGSPVVPACRDQQPDLVGWSEGFPGFWGPVDPTGVPIPDLVVERLGMLWPVILAEAECYTCGQADASVM